MYVNVFYFKRLNSIGGIETFFWQLGKKYGKKYDITVFYQDGDAEQVRRLSQYIRTKRYKPDQKIRCKRAFLCFNLDIIDNIEADEYWQMLHGDYVSLGVYPDTNPKITKYISVSKVVRDSYEKGTGEDSIICHNPFTPVKPRKVLNLISATRLSPDKGANRMNQLSEILDRSGIPYIWTIYTDSPRGWSSPNVIYRAPRLDIVDYIANSDYYVQLSDAEGYCYSVVEALSVGTPVIVTNFKVVHEIGVIDGVNGFILPMDMSEVPVARIYKGLKKFKYIPLEDCWDDLLLPGKSDEFIDPKATSKVRCKKVYLDLELDRMVGYGEEWQCLTKRADYLADLGLVDIVE